LVDANGNTLPAVINDRLGAIYSQARTDQNLKTQLFLHTMCRISRAYLTNVNAFKSPQQPDNTAVVDIIINDIITALEGSVIQTQTTNQLLAGLDKGVNTGALTSDSIRSSMKSGTTMTRIVEQFMSNVLSQFRNKTSAIQGKFTRYGGYLDTVVMMMAFDFIISLVARYSNQRLVGFHTGQQAFSQGLITFAISQTSTNNRNSINELNQRASSEDSRVQRVLLAVTNVLRVLQGSLKGLSNYLQSDPTKQLLGQLATALQNNRDALRMLFSEQQILLIASLVEDLLVANGTDNPVRTLDTSQPISNDELKILDETILPLEAHDALFGLFGSGRYASPTASNLRALTVGIPLGFTQRIKQKVNIQNAKRASFTTKRNDIVSICVYRIDLQNSDIVFKPQRFLFELSRFPVRLATTNWLPFPKHATADDVINSIPTQNYTQDVSVGTSNSLSAGIEYSPTVTQSLKTAFAGPAYDFLTQQQKNQLQQNHITSQLLDAYIHLMTGINVAESTFEMITSPLPMEPSFVQRLTSHTLRHVHNTSFVKKMTAQSNPTTRPTGGVMFSTTTRSTGIAGNVGIESQFKAFVPSTTTVQALEQQSVVGSATENLDKISFHDVPVVVQHLATVTTLANTVNSYSNADAVNQKLLTPKMFDRVFNVLVDPSAFEIDVQTTIATPYGKQAFDLLIKSGDVIEADESTMSSFITRRHPGIFPVRGSRSFTQGGLSPNLHSYVFRERDKGEGDLIADQYFVTVETLDEDS
jgi:hypothetical protein